jgi:DNA-binding response OmpR family regulator
VLRYNGLQSRDKACLVVDDHLSLDLGRALAHTPDRTIRLTSMEARLLYHLAQNTGQPISNDELMRRL